MEIIITAEDLKAYLKKNKNRTHFCFLLALLDAFDGISQKSNNENLITHMERCQKQVICTIDDSCSKSLVRLVGNAGYGIGQTLHIRRILMKQS